MVGMDTAWIKRLMKKTKVTQIDLGKAIGRDRSVISRIITGEQPLKLNEVETFARKLGVPKPEMLRRAGLDLKTVDVAPTGKPGETVANLVGRLTALDVRSIRAIREFLIGEKPLQGRARKELLALNKDAMIARKALRERVERA